MESIIAEFGSSVFDQHIGCLYVECNGFLAYSELVNLLERGYKLIQRYHLTTCLINLQKMSVYPEEATDYLQNVWYQNMIQGGICRVAYVVPDDIFARINMNDAHDASTIEKLEKRYFTSEEEAKTWLQN